MIQRSEDLYLLEDLGDLVLFEQDFGYLLHGAMHPDIWILNKIHLSIGAFADFADDVVVKFRFQLVVSNELGFRETFGDLAAFSASGGLRLW